MTPLTHAAVGTAIYRTLRSPWVGRWGWTLALPLAFVSHYLLDAIPHFERLGPLRRYLGQLWVFLAFGVIGMGLATYLFRRNREAGLIWLTLSFWIGLAGISGSLVEVLGALALLGFVAYHAKRAEAVGYVLAGILAVAADLVPRSLNGVEQFHNRMHYQVDWGTYLYFKYHSSPVPMEWRFRLQDPYFLLGYGLELLVKAGIFLGAFSIFAGLRFKEKPPMMESETTDSVNARVGTRAQI